MRKQVFFMLTGIMLATTTIASASAWSCSHSSKRVETEWTQITPYSQSHSCIEHKVNYKHTTICNDCQGVLSTVCTFGYESHSMEAVQGSCHPNGTQTWRLLCRDCGYTATESDDSLDTPLSLIV